MTDDKGSLGANPRAGRVVRALEANADRMGTRIALDGDTGALSWHHFDRRAASVAALLSGGGRHRGGEPRPGGRVGLYLQDSSDYLEVVVGALKAGMSPVGIPARYRADDLTRALAACEAGAVFFHATYAARLWEVRHQAPSVRQWVQVDDGTELLVDFASDYDQAVRDTPPAPRAERPSAEVLVLPAAPGPGDAEALAPYLDRALSAGRAMDPGVTVVAGPLSHPEALAFGALAPLWRGATVVTVRPPLVDPHRLWSDAQEYRATEVVVIGSPRAAAAVEALAEADRLGAGYDLSALERLVVGASWGDPERREFGRHCGAEVVEIDTLTG